MEFFNKLDEEQQSKISALILSKASLEHEQAYKANVVKAKNEKEKMRCAGKYVGKWQRLHNKWISLKVCNLYVFHCLQIDHVDNDPFGVEFTNC